MMLSRLGIVAILFTGAGLASAASFTVRDLEGIYNGRLSYGMLYRLGDRDRDLIAIASEGNAPTANTDDGNLNYGKGVVSNTVRAAGEVALRWGDFGAYVRGSAFYDFENQSSDPARTDFDSDAEKLVGSDIELRESYLNWRLRPGGMPVLLRVGQHGVTRRKPDRRGRAHVDREPAALLQEHRNLLGPVAE